MYYRVKGRNILYALQEHQAVLCLCALAFSQWLKHSALSAVNGHSSENYVVNGQITQRAGQTFDPWLHL